MFRLASGVTIALILGSMWSASAATITLDGQLGDWTGPDIVNLGTQPAATGSYTVYATTDATNLYIGVDRDSTDRYLGDTAGTNDSFFVAIDHAAGGSSSDGYGNVNFTGADRPDRIYYYAGGSGWYEASSWNGTGWDWIGWTNTNTYYGWAESNPNDELLIPLSDIGGDAASVRVWAWMIDEEGSAVTASWPSGFTGSGPSFGDGLSVIPEPASLALISLGGLAMLRRRH